jgi:hypothetical protein
MDDTKQVDPLRTILRLSLVACLLLGLLSASAGSALAMPHAKRLAKTCKKAKSPARSSTVARPTPIRAGDTRKRAAVKRPLRKRCFKKKVKAKRKAAKPNTSADGPSAPGGHESSQPGSPSSPAAPGSTTPEPAPGDTTAPLPPSNPHALQVVSTEFQLSLSKAEVLAGNVRVEFNNMFAEDPHDLHLVREDGTGDSFSFGERQAGEVEAKTLRLTAGGWQLFCALPEHLQRGMSARLRVRAG